MTKVIESLAWDMTIGAGNTEQPLPKAKDVEAICVELGRPLTPDEFRTFRAAWARCILEAAQP